ncbi:MAG: DEAD/DEAH box helicase [Treponema sp.]|jgi:superfamily II DNA/RNA helicase|nr:DEAD/DEAH box helicase [Treponema sp.]
MTFADLGLSSFLVERLGVRGINAPTEIQHLVIPRVLAGENVLFRSATGTGKTFAYLLPLFERLLIAEVGGAFPRVLIIAPTLELCSQIKQEADFLLKDKPYCVSLLIGAANMSRQIETLKKDKPDVIVGNTARLLQLERMGKLKLSRVEALVLDEGDRLISDELLTETTMLLERINPRQAPARQTLACSATMSPQSRERLIPLLGEALITLETEEQEILRERISHWAFFSEERRKISTLSALLIASGAKKALVFTTRGGQVGNIVSQLQYHKIAAVGLHSDMEKKARKQAMDAFRSEQARVLVSSDLAARGLDIPAITHIISLDVPLSAEAYIHRAGRTARAGRRGVVASIGDAEELRHFAQLEKKLGITVYPKALYKGRIVTPEMV